MLSINFSFAFNSLFKKKTACARRGGWLLLMIIMVSNEINDGGEIMVSYHTES